MANQIKREYYFETLKWIRSNGGPWNILDIIDAARNNYFMTLRRQDPVLSELDLQASSQVITNSYLETLMWIKDNRGPCNTREMNAINRDIKWIDEKKLNQFITYYSNQ